MTSQPLVFVVDNEEPARRGVCRLVQSVGVEARCFDSPLDFLAQLPCERPSCLVLDLRLPGMSGLELQHELINSRRRIPIIFVTAHGDVPSSVRAMKAGALDFFQKPVNEQELLDAIHRALAADSRVRTAEAERAGILERVHQLTYREREVLELVVEGHANKNIAALLGIAEKTVKIHRGQVMRKMRSSSVAELVRMTVKVKGSN